MEEQQYCYYKPLLVNYLSYYIIYLCCLGTFASVAWCYYQRKKPAKPQSEKMDPSWGATVPAFFFRQLKMFHYCSLFLFLCLEHIATLWEHYFPVCASFSVFPNTKRHGQRADCETEAKIQQIKLNSIIWVVCFVFPCRWTETWLQNKLCLENKEEGKNNAGYLDVCKRSSPLRPRLPFSNMSKQWHKFPTEKKIQL